MTESEYLIPLPLVAPIQSLFFPLDVEIDSLLEAPKARNDFKVSGKGFTVAVMDTGLRVTHQCFTGRVKSTKDFTNSSAQDTDVTDSHGHGTNVTGIIAAAAGDVRSGIAPEAGIVALKVIPALGVNTLVSALKWVEHNALEFNITVVNLSLGVPLKNFQSDEELSSNTEYQPLANMIKSLAEKQIAVVVAAGNDYAKFESEGMTIPAIFRDAISVGAVYDSSVGKREYKEVGAIAYSTHADQITPFSQRLSKETNKDCYTDIFSAGDYATSAGHLSDDDTSTQSGTSQATPTIAGVILLMQEYYYRRKNELPPISLLQDALRASSTWIDDIDQQDDNVKHTGKRFPRANAYRALAAIHNYCNLS